MKATDPIVFPGDRVQVENYKAHTIEKPIEPASVVEVKTTWLSPKKCLHQYLVKLDRQLKGRPILLSVNERRIREKITVS